MMNAKFHFGTILHNVCSVHGGMFSTSRDIMMQVGRYHEYIGACSVHGGFQYKSKTFMNLLPHMTHYIP